MTNDQIQMTNARVATRRLLRVLALAVSIALAVFALRALPATAQQSVRPGTSHDDPIDVPHDLSGYSVRGPRIHVVHTSDAALAGGSMYLQQIDPWLGYLIGRETAQREMTPQQGVFGEVSKPDGVLLPDGSTHMMERDHVSSCLFCHNTPYRDAGAGVTIPKNGGTGRNTPHLFGDGLVEMLGGELRLAAMAIADDDRNGWIDLVEAKDKRFLYGTTPDAPADGGAELDFGRFDDNNLDGVPDLNPVLYVVYVDGHGDRIPWAEKLTDPGVKGYRLEVQVFGHGHMRVSNRPPVPGTLRAFTAGAFDIHLGMQAYDPTILDEDGHTGLAQMSNAGCQQYVTAAGRDRGKVLDKLGNSLDDPDRDGMPSEMSQGELDAVEWYLLNHPRPAVARQTERTRRGQALLAEIGCTSCHTPNWCIPAGNHDAEDYTQRHCGDRRLFDVEVSYNDENRRLEGKLVPLYEMSGDRCVPRCGAFRVEGLYSDLRYHDLGPKFHQMQFDGSVIKHFRTAPLWGVGTTAPYGHDGADLSLESVILRHGGEAEESREAFAALEDGDQEAVLAFLRSLVLYQTDTLPCDINGDGRIDEHFMVAGQDVGLETLRPEWLLKEPCRIEGPTTGTLGELIISMAITNVRQAYGLDLPYLADSDEDGWPDVIDPMPNEPGIK